MCTNDDIKAKVEEFQRENVKDHAVINTNFHKSLRALEDSLTLKHIELANNVKDAVDKLDTAASKVDLAAQAALTASESAKASGNITKFMKIMFSLAVLIIGGLIGWDVATNLTNQNLKIELIQEKQNNTATLDSIYDILKESKKMTMMLDTKALMDSIQLWRKENKDEIKWTHQVFDEQIVTSFKLSRKNSFYLKGHEARIQRLEGRLD